MINRIWEQLYCTKLERAQRLADRSVLKYGMKPMKIYGPFLKFYGPFETFFWFLLNGTKGQFWICWCGHGEEEQELFPCRWLHLICIELLLWLVEIPLLLTLKLLQGRLCTWSYSFWIFWKFLVVDWIWFW